MQKLPKAIAEQAGIPTDGHAGVHIGASGRVSSIMYSKHTDGRMEFDRLGWMSFLEGRDLEISQPVLIILRETDDPSLEIMIEMQLI